VPDPAFDRFEAIDLAAVDRILDEADHDPARLLHILEATQDAYGYLPVAALKRISHLTGTWYAMVYGTASYYRHLRFEPPTVAGPEAGSGAGLRRPDEAAYLADLATALGASAGGAG
jgi:hypothetical protein